MIKPIEKVVDNCGKDSFEVSKHANVGVVKKAATQILCEKTAHHKLSTRQLSCPPLATRSITSGLWSLEWLKDHVHGAAGVVSSSKHFSKQSLKSNIVVESKLQNKLKAGGKLKHSAHNLKKIARLPDKDRKQVLNILMKKVRRRKAVKLADALPDSMLSGTQTSGSSSSESVNNNDRKNWLLMKGKEKEVQNDITDFGKALGVRFYNDKCNQFSIVIKR